MKAIEIGRHTPDFAEPILTLNVLNFFDGWQDRVDALKDAVDPSTLRFTHHPDLVSLGTGIDYLPGQEYLPQEYLDSIEHETAILLSCADEIVDGREYPKPTLRILGKK